MTSRCPQPACGGWRMLEMNQPGGDSLVCVLCGRSELLPDPASDAAQARDAALARAERDAGRQGAGRRRKGGEA